MKLSTNAEKRVATWLVLFKATPRVADDCAEMLLRMDADELQSESGLVLTEALHRFYEEMQA